MSFYEKCFFSPLCDLTDLCRDPLGRRCLHLAKSTAATQSPQNQPTVATSNELEKVQTLFDQIRANYYQEVDEDVLVEGALKE